MIGILHHKFPDKRFCKVAECAVANADWPLGPLPEGVSVFGDLPESAHIVIEFRSKAMLADLSGLRCRVSAMMCEPPAVHRRYYRLIRWLARRYHRVLTHNSGLLSRLPNARFLPHGGCWLKAKQETPLRDKTKGVALIASKKHWTVGHKLRHRIAEWSQESGEKVDLFGRGYQPLDDKAEGHLSHRYSVVIENSREPGYFTEKLIDSLLCESLPIYWGAPDIAHFFDPRGLIICGNEAELCDAVKGATNAGFERRLAFLRENRQRALAFVDRHRNAALLLKQEDEMAGAIGAV